MRLMSNKELPLVSVVMSVYNAERYVGEAIESILGQSFRDFEFIIINDSSTDRSGEILHSFQDERIISVKNAENIGLTKSLNKGLQMAKGEYIARMDADDISLPERLEKQVCFLEAHPEVGLVGSAVIYIDPDGKELGVQRVRPEDFHQALLDIDFCWEHSATMFRAVCVETVGPYREEFKYAQDYDLWLRIAEKFDLDVLREPLIKSRLHPDAISIAKGAYQRAYVTLAVALAKQRRLIGQENLSALLGGRGEIDSDSLPALLPEEVGRMYLRTACLNYLLGDIARAKQALTEAVRCAPTLLENAEGVLRFIVYYAFDHAATLTSRLGAVHFMNRVFANLPPAAEALLRFKSKALGELYMLFAFESYEVGNLFAVRREVPLAIIHDPSWLRNRGVWSIFLKSLVGTRHLGRGERPLESV